MGKTKPAERSKKQQKYYLHLARQNRKKKMKRTPQLTERKVVLMEEPVEKASKTVEDMPEKMNSDDAISINASDSDFK